MRRIAIGSRAIRRIGGHRNILVMRVVTLSSEHAAHDVVVALIREGEVGERGLRLGRRGQRRRGVVAGQILAEVGYEERRAVNVVTIETADVLAALEQIVIVSRAVVELPLLLPVGSAIVVVVVHRVAVSEHVAARCFGDAPGGKVLKDIILFEVVGASRPEVDSITFRGWASAVEIAVADGDVV